MLVQPEKELISGKEVSRSSDRFSDYFAAGPGAEAMWAVAGRPAPDRAAQLRTPLAFCLNLMSGPRKWSLLPHVAILSKSPLLLFTTACLFNWLTEDRWLHLA